MSINRWHSTEGAPYPLGVTWIEAEQAYNFAIYSKHAESVTLLLFSSNEPEQESLRCSMDFLRNKSGRIWHCRLPKDQLNDARYYAYCITGPSANGMESHAFDGCKALLDPYAKSVYFPPNFNRRAAIEPGANVGRAPLGLLLEDEAPFDWLGERRPHHGSELIIYEMHVKGFTRRKNSGVRAGNRGTYAGVIEKIPYLQELGVTAVELMPVFQFDPQEGNYWGYMTLNFFSPHHEYAAASDPLEEPNEFRAMVKALHNANIEVILDVVYNHTAEGKS